MEQYLNKTLSVTHNLLDYPEFEIKNFCSEFLDSQIECSDIMVYSAVLELSLDFLFQTRVYEQLVSFFQQSPYPYNEIYISQLKFANYQSLILQLKRDILLKRIELSYDFLRSKNFYIVSFQEDRNSLCPIMELWNVKLDNNNRVLKVIRLEEDEKYKFDYSHILCESIIAKKILTKYKIEGVLALLIIYFHEMYDIFLKGDGPESLILKRQVEPFNTAYIKIKNAMKQNLDRADKIILPAQNLLGKRNFVQYSFENTNLFAIIYVFMKQSLYRWITFLERFIEFDSLEKQLNSWHLKKKIQYVFFKRIQKNGKDKLLFRNQDIWTSFYKNYDSICDQEYEKLSEQYNYKPEFEELKRILSATTRQEWLMVLKNLIKYNATSLWKLVFALDPGFNQVLFGHDFSCEYSPFKLLVSSKINFINIEGGKYYSECIEYPIQATTYEETDEWDNIYSSHHYYEYDHRNTTLMIRHKQRNQDEVNNLLAEKNKRKKCN